MEIKKPLYNITIIGCGPGSIDYVTPLARKAAIEASVLVGARRLLDLFPECQAERIALSADIENLLNKVETLVPKERIAILVTGDPGLMSLAANVIKRFGIENCRVIPGISALQVACARIGIDWPDIKIIDAHTAEPDLKPEILKGESKIAVFSGKGLPWIVRLAHTLRNDYQLYVFENLTLEHEKITEMSPDELNQNEISSLSIMIFNKEHHP